MLDVKLPPVAGREPHHGAIASVAGGSAVNAARAAARLGATTAVAGAVGNDTLGKVIRIELEAAGVTPLLDLLDGETTGTVVYGGPSVIADRGANAVYLPRELPPARVTLVSAYLGGDARARALELASGLTAVDLQGVLADQPGADVVLGPHLGLDLDHAVVCSTLGRDGAEARAGDKRARVAPTRILDDPLVGAGDVFAAGFLLALADGAALEEALRRGCAAVTG